MFVKAEDPTVVGSVVPVRPRSSRPTLHRDVVHSDAALSCPSVLLMSTSQGTSGPGGGCRGQCLFRLRAPRVALWEPLAGTPVRCCLVCVAMSQSLAAAAGEPGPTAFLLYFLSGLMSPLCELCDLLWVRNSSPVGGSECSGPQMLVPGAECLYSGSPPPT